MMLDASSLNRVAEVLIACRCDSSSVIHVFNKPPVFSTSPSEYCSVMWLAQFSHTKQTTTHTKHSTIDHFYNRSVASVRNQSSSCLWTLC